VLVTRPEGRSDVLAVRLRGLGAHVETRPTISLEPPTDPGPARHAVAELAHFDWVVFTSAHGVRFFRALLREIRGKDATFEARVATIGPATAREAELEGFRPEVVAEEARSDGLARALEGRIVPGERVLLVRPEVASPLLPEALCELEARPEPVAFYRNVPAPGLEALAEEVCEDRFDVVVLTSPSTLHRLLEAGGRTVEELRAALGRSRVVAIGPVTARAVESTGLVPEAVATEPTVEAIVRAVRSLFD
jgi:uroporphyrinogen-III synthase